MEFPTYYIFVCVPMQKRPVILKGTKVALGPLIKEDLERLWFWVNDKEVTQYLAMHPTVYPLESERTWLENVLRGEDKNNIIFAILLLPELEHVGNVGLHFIDRFNRNAELGIMIGAKEHWNKGYGTEAIILALDYAFNIMDLKVVRLRVYEFNRRGIRCYEKVGFKHVGRLRKHLYRGGKWWDVLLMDITREEFNSLHKSVAKIICKDVFKEE